MTSYRLFDHPELIAGIDEVLAKSTTAMTSAEIAAALTPNLAAVEKVVSGATVEKCLVVHGAQNGWNYEPPNGSAPRRWSKR